MEFFGIRKLHPQELDRSGDKLFIFLSGSHAQQGRSGLGEIGKPNALKPLSLYIGRLDRLEQPLLEPLQAMDKQKFLRRVKDLGTFCSAP